MIEMIICDDMQEHITILKQLIKLIATQKKLDIKIALATTNIDRVAQYASEHRGSFDRVYILDIDLNGHKTGLDLAKLIRNNDRRSYIVFLTGHMEYMHQSFKVKPFDFLIKPIRKERLVRLIEALVKDIQMIKRDDKEPKIQIVVGSTTHFIQPSDIIYMEKLGRLLSINMKNQVIQCYYNLKTLEAELVSYNFCRCHKSFLVNMEHVVQYNRQKNTLIMLNGAQVPVSRTYRKDVDNLVGKI